MSAEDYALTPEGSGRFACREVARMKIPTHCDCGDQLYLHCGSAESDCQWLKCRNPRCVWENFDVERGVRTHRDGHAEAAPAQ